MVYWLLHNGFLPTEMDANYDTPLHNLVENGHNHETVNVLRIASMLIDKGAMVDCINMQGKSPLHLVVQCIRKYDTTTLIAIMQLFLTNGADINRLVSNINLDNGESLLHIALNAVGAYRPIPNFIFCFDICEFLLNNGIDKNNKRIYGRTPLHLACDYGNYVVVELLIQHGAGIHIRDLNGLMPADILTPIHNFNGFQVGQDHKAIMKVLKYQNKIYMRATYTWLKQSWMINE